VLIETIVLRLLVLLEFLEVDVQLLLMALLLKMVALLELRLMR
jgi:hypothetical protein